MAYTKTTWVNGSAPALDATNLNKIETGIDDAHDAAAAAVQPADVGTAAALDVPASGDAATGEVVKGDDTRLSDARTPTAHTHTVSDVTDAGTAASKDVGTGSGDVAAGDHTHDARYYTETEIDAQLQAVEGGETRVNTVATSGAAETLPAEYAAHKVTMDQACTFTFTSPTEDGAAFALYLSGAFTPTFPASVVWDGGSAPTYGSPSLYVFATFDGGTSWVGSLVGSSLA